MLAWVVAVGAVLPGVVALPNERTVYFGPRVTVVLVLAALGLPILALRTWRSAVSWSARAAVAFLVVASVSAALSTAPLIGFFGANEVGTGWLFLVGLAALWARGTGVGTSGASLLGKGLLVLELLNAGRPSSRWAGRAGRCSGPSSGAGGSWPAGSAWGRT